MIPQRDGHMSQVANQIQYISTCRRIMETKLQSEVLTYLKGLLQLKQNDLLIAWPTAGQVTTWKICIFTLTTLLATKLVRVLIYGMRFSTKTLKPSPKSCLILESCCLQIDSLAFNSILLLSYWQNLGHPRRFALCNI